jgi:hypothetical protein
MIIAMIAMGMVKVAVDQIIDVIAVRHGFVAAIGTVDMPFGVAANLVIASAFIGMRSIHLNHVFFNLAVLLMHQMSAYEIIHVPVMFNRRMTATGAVPMIF